MNAGAVWDRYSRKLVKVQRIAVCWTCGMRRTLAALRTCSISYNGQLLKPRGICTLYFFYTRLIVELCLGTASLNSCLLPWLCVCLMIYQCLWVPVCGLLYWEQRNIYLLILPWLCVCFVDLPVLVWCWVIFRALVSFFFKTTFRFFNWRVIAKGGNNVKGIYFFSKNNLSGTLLYM